MTIQIKESQLPQELRNLRPPVYKGDSILITEVHDCDIEACKQAVGQVQEFSHMEGAKAATVDDVWAKSWVKVNEPVEKGDRILLLRRLSGGSDNVGSVVVVASKSIDAPFFSVGSEGSGFGIACTWVKMPALAEEEPPTTFQVCDVVRYHDRDLPVGLGANPSHLVGAIGVVTSVRQVCGRGFLSTDIAESYGYDDPRRFDLVRRAGEQKQEEPKAPFVVGDWVKDTSDGNRIGKVTEDISSLYLHAYKNYYDNEFSGAFGVEFVDGKPMRFACVWGSELEKLEVNPEVKEGDYITVLERASWGDQDVKLPYTGKVHAIFGCNHHIKTPGEFDLVGRVFIKGDAHAQEAAALTTQDKPKYKVGDLVTINEKGRTFILPTGTLMRVQEVVDNRGVVLEEVEIVNQRRYAREFADVDPFTEDISVGDKVVLTEAAFDVFAPVYPKDVVGKFVKKCPYYLVSGIEPSRLVHLARPEIQKWTPHRESVARQKLDALKAEKAEADKAKAREIRLEELKAATVAKQGEYLYRSEPGSDWWIEYKRSSFTFDSNELIDDEDNREIGDGPIEILK